MSSPRRYRLAAATFIAIAPTIALGLPAQADPDWNMFSIHCSRLTLTKYTPPTNGNGYAGHSWAYLSDGSAFIVSPQADPKAFDYAFVAKLRRSDRVFFCLYDGSLRLPSRPTELPQTPLDPRATRRVTVENPNRTATFVYATFGFAGHLTHKRSGSVTPRGVGNISKDEIFKIMAEVRKAASKIH